MNSKILVVDDDITVEGRSVFLGGVNLGGSKVAFFLVIYKDIVIGECRCWTNEEVNSTVEVYVDESHVCRCRLVLDGLQ